MHTPARPRHRSAQLAAALATFALFAAGCSEAEKAFNRGGDTTCGDYLQLDDHQKRVTVTKYLQQRAGNDNDPPGTSVDLTMVAVGGLCNLPGKASVPIKDATGIPSIAPPS